MRHKEKEITKWEAKVASWEKELDEWEKALDVKEKELMAKEKWLLEFEERLLAQGWESSPTLKKATSYELSARKNLTEIDWPSTTMDKDKGPPLDY